ADDTAGVASGITYDKTTQTLVFNAAHFTIFKAVESSSTSSSSGTSAPTTPGCSNQSPDHSPDLFQIDTSKSNAKLFFTPVNNAVDYYYIAYGFTEGDERFGVKFDKGYYDGVIDYTVNELAPNTSYYFRVRAGNGCATGAWSNWMLAKTDGGFAKDVKEAVIEPTKSAESPTLGVSDSVAPNQQVTQPTVKKSWQQKVTIFFKVLFKL
ncbi:MAG: fibronectin type III domain-containing protein, partial [Patescibacteria group bacterium]